MSQNFDFDKFFSDIDKAVNTLDQIDELKELGFTKTQARFVNLLIARAIDRYDKLTRS